MNEAQLPEFKGFFRGVFRLYNCQQPLPRDGA